MEGLLLLLVAIVIATVLIPVGIFYGIIISFWKHRFKTGWKGVNNNLRTLAVAIDIYGNVACGDLLNHSLIYRASPYKFGQHGQTISAVLGLNLMAGHLRAKGRWLNRQLDRIEVDHARKAAWSLIEKYPQAYPEFASEPIADYLYAQTTKHDNVLPTR